MSKESSKKRGRNNERSTSARQLVEQVRVLLREPRSRTSMLPPIWRRQPLDIRASPNCIERALCIAEMFLSGIEQRGHQVIVPFKGHEPATLLVNGETLGFRIDEKRNRVSVPSSRRTWPNETELIPSGVMRVTIYHPPLKSYRREKVWEDGPRKGKIENQMGVILDGIELLTDDIKQYQAYLEEVWRQQAIKREEERRMKDLLRKEEVRRRQLYDDAQLWAECTRMRAFVDTVEEAALKHVADTESELVQWIVWARNYITSIEPLHDLGRYSLG
ncbi:MAG: hypothetical protein JST22_18955 [Bacteroidetes bacterium]|nr:hypothetical protein [Bacteroidota bacterium]